MANRLYLTIAGAAVAFGLLVSSAVKPASVRLPWAATSGLHFIEAIVNADNYRAAASGIAIKKSMSPDVRDFGRELWEHSIEDVRRLRWLLNQTDPGVVLPSTVSPHYLFVIDELLPVTGDAFDKRFIVQQTASLEEALALAQAYARLGDDFDLKEYAARSVPNLKKQLDRIREIERRHVALASR